MSGAWSRSVYIMLLCATLAACGARGFNKDGATHDDFMLDMRQCLYEANRPQNSASCYPGVPGPCQRDEVRNACMEAKGWRITREEGRFFAPN